MNQTELERLLEAKNQALAAAWRDILEWTQLATNHRKALGERADFEPYCPSKQGIERSEEVLRQIGMAACLTETRPTCGADPKLLLKQREALRKACQLALNWATGQGPYAGGKDTIPALALEVAPQLEAALKLVTLPESSLRAPPPPDPGYPPPVLDQNAASGH